MNTSHKIGLVTGSSKGIGRGIALRLAAESYHVVVTYHTDKDAGLQTLAQIQQGGGSGELHSLDVRSEDSVKAIFRLVEKQYGHLDLLVNNAVKEVAKSIEQASFDEWCIVTETKINGTFLCCKYAIPLLVKSNNANIINITSFDGEKPKPEYLGYCVGTAGIIAITKALAISLPTYGIRVNAVCPGPTRTPLWDKLGGENEEMWLQFARDNPMGRIATIDDVASGVMLLVADPHKFLNGNFLYVNGGSHLR